VELEVSGRLRSPYIAESVASCAGCREQPDDSLLFAIQANQIQQHNLKTLPASAIAGCKVDHSCRIDGFAKNRARVDDGRRPIARAASPFHVRRHGHRKSIRRPCGGMGGR
jgi:hypothetical protein